MHKLKRPALRVPGRSPTSDSISDSSTNVDALIIEFRDFVLNQLQDFVHALLGVGFDAHNQLRGRVGRAQQPQPSGN